MKSLSLKFKLLGLLVFVTTSMVMVYAYVALKDFENDKVAYVRDSNMSQVSSIAGQVRSEIENVIEKMEFLLRGYEPVKGFHRYNSRVFSSESIFDWIVTFQVEGRGESKGRYAVFNVLQKKNLTAPDYQAMADHVIQRALTSEVAVDILEDVPGSWLLALKFEHPNSRQPVVAVAQVNRSRFVSSFLEPQIQDNYFIDKNNEIITETAEKTYVIEASDLSSLIQDIGSRLTSRLMSEEYLAADEEKWLVAAARVGVGDMKVLSIIPKSAALQAVDVLMLKSLFFLALLFCLTVIVSVFAANTLTATLKKLSKATENVSQGNFDIEVEVKSEDEVGTLARGFNHMTKEIKRLLSETAEKARMESELKTARTVQSNLFPDEDYVSETVQVQGFYQPASECSGDWWFYTKIGPKFFFWIGDATGHGVPAALVTAAAKSAAGVLQNFPDLAISKVVELFNRAIYGTSHGNVMMTFFMGCFNEDTGEFTYTNASHDPPFLLSRKDEPLKKRDIQTLLDNTGKRLGEGPDSEYEETTFQLKDGDRIIFYTDGVTELNNDSGDMLGERRFIKTLLDSYNDSPNLDKCMVDLQETITDFRKEHPLQDDVTYFMFQFQKAS